MKRLAILFTLVIFFVVFPTPNLTQNSFADVYVNSSEKFKIEIDLSGNRWELGSISESTDSKGNELQYIQIHDIEDAADVLLIVQLSELTSAEIDAWFQKHTERFLIVYSHRAHSIDEVDEKEEIPVTLGSGQTVRSVRYDLTVDGDRREVRFVYFFSTDGSMQCFIFIYNDGLYKNQSQEVKTISDGISFME